MSYMPYTVQQPHDNVLIAPSSIIFNKIMQDFKKEIIVWRKKDQMFKENDMKYSKNWSGINI